MIDEGSGGEEPHGDEDDLSELETSMSRLARRARWPVALVLVLALSVPMGGWLVDELAYRSASDAVDVELGDAAFLAEAVMLVRATDCSGHSSSGSAFALRMDGEDVLVTNRHVVDGAASVGVRRLDGGPAVRIAEHRVSEIADVAVLELPAGTDMPASLPTGRQVAVGRDVRVIGFPGGRPATTVGPVSGVSPDRLRLDLEVMAGASGSPVVDMDGRVVGQVFARTEDGRGIATPLGRLLEAATTTIPERGC